MPNKALPCLMQETTHEAYMNMTMTLLPRGASLAACTVIAAAVLFAAFNAPTRNPAAKNSYGNVRQTKEAVLKHNARQAAQQEKESVPQKSSKKSSKKAAQQAVSAPACIDT